MRLERSFVVPQVKGEDHAVNKVYKMHGKAIVTDEEGKPIYLGPPEVAFDPHPRHE